MPPNKRSPWRLPLVCALIIITLGGLGGVIFAEGSLEWYQSMKRPPGTPPPWVFGPVWIVLYAMIGISLGLLLKNRQQPATRFVLAVFCCQLVLNFAWTPLFFGAHQTGLALIDIVAMCLSIFWTIFLAKKISPTAAYLLIPYLIWVSCATYLNAGFWWLNR